MPNESSVISANIYPHMLAQRLNLAPVSGRTPYRRTSLLLLTWLAVQCFIYWQTGIVSDGEASKYIYEARRLLQEGSFSTGNYLFYSIPILLLALGIHLKAGFFVLLVTQLILNAVATIAFYKLCRLYTSETKATIAAAVLILHYPFQEFNLMLQTESLFFSLTIIYSYMLFSTVSWTTSKAFLLILLSLTLILTRPAGILVILPTLLFFYFKFCTKWNPILKLGLLGTATALFYVFLSAVMQSGGELNFLLPLIQEHIICGVATNNFSVIAEPGGPFEVLNFIVNNPETFSKLAVSRSIAFFGLFRNYYSAVHNLYLVILFLPIYILAAISLRAWFRKNRPEIIYLLSMIGITWLMVMFTCDDWHNRFILALTPLLLLTAMPALKRRH